MTRFPVANPLKAYALDLEARPGAASLGASDAQWLALATALHRLSTLSPAARKQYLAALEDADAGSGSPAPSNGNGGGDYLVDQPHRIAARLAHEGGAEVEQAMSAIHRIVEGMENQHAFHLAFATLGAARGGTIDLSPLLQGRLAAHQARVARQLGDLETAEDLYATTTELGTAHGHGELLVRGHVGAALIADTRGNNPAARREYELALEHAAAAPHVAVLAHHGLMVVASKAGDLGAAIRHAWAAFEGVAGDPVRRVDLLINLAELARRAGQAAIALRAFRQALAHTELARLRLPALGGVARAAAELEDRPALDALAENAEREAASSGIPYENARLWMELAHAFATVGEAERATDYARRAETLAAAHGFHEVDLRAADLSRSVARPRRRAEVAHPDPATRDILRQVDALARASRDALVG